MDHLIAPSSRGRLTSIHYCQRKGARTHHRCVPRPPRYTILRRIRVIAGRSGEGLLTEPTTATQPRRQEPLFMSSSPEEFHLRALPEPCTEPCYDRQSSSSQGLAGSPYCGRVSAN